VKGAGCDFMGLSANLRLDVVGAARICYPQPFVSFSFLAFGSSTSTFIFHLVLFYLLSCNEEAFTNGVVGAQVTSFKGPAFGTCSFVFLSTLY
jgi:hypothetical protein